MFLALQGVDGRVPPHIAKKKTALIWGSMSHTQGNIARKFLNSTKIQVGNQTHFTFLSHQIFSTVI